MTSGLGFRFTHSISRMPGQSIASGLRAGGGPDPDPALFIAQHKAYLVALGEAGVEPSCLPALEAYPDSVFVEDPALCMPQGAILLRPGAKSRAGETQEMLPVLYTHFDTVHILQGPGMVDGGDIMVTDDEVLVGLSARTDESGFSELETLLAGWGHKARMVQTPASILHFKTASSFLGDNTILCTEVMAQSGVFDAYQIVQVAKGEEAAANAIRVNDTILLSAGFPKTAQILRERFADLKLVELDTSQAALVDGGLSCMSLRFSRV
ncbi:arginine deiminase family protein [Cohaesibacter celericrescens]|uniref:Dimethylarginine dimethylaminohydrolase n=1 Tax=Cohaesibacter celericrescens TaxID=2067669 RepID=A0A2N5XRH4_9HYPH|nr:arginine deiminase family protein [Cohaesibacter celericrescens]PLW77018.1 dimethylarginine dimethylaminohydrolase [Cohaesibacter celericrescens]